MTLGVPRLGERLRLPDEREPQNGQCGRRTPAAMTPPTLSSQVAAAGGRRSASRGAVRPTARR